MTTAELKQLVAIAQANIPSLENRPDLEARNSDSEDFYDVAVWCIKDALIEAYELGKIAGRTEARLSDIKETQEMIAEVKRKKGI